MRMSAGILLYKYESKELYLFLVHPGGPFWKNKDIGAWSIPKGEFQPPEDPLEAARREFFEETGTEISGTYIELSPVKQKGGKLVYAWAFMGSLDPASIVSNTFRLEWPYNSGKWKTFPEVDKAGWFTVKEAKTRIIPAQFAFIEELQQHFND